MADWSLPALTSIYTNTLTEIKNRDIDLALQFDGTTSTSIPTGAIRWTSSANTWQKWTGSAWGALSSTFAFPAITTSGDQSIVAQHNGNAATWYGRILSKNSTADRAAFLGTYGSNTGVFAHNNALNAWADLYVNTSDGNSGGNVRLPGTTFIQGNQALHAGNYSSYSPTLTGTGASGTWGISITGTAATDTTRAPLASPTFTGSVTIPAGASIAGYAPLASPTFTGTPAAPTATAGTNTTQLATTAFVSSAISTSNSAVRPIANGGTGQTSAAAALLALLPSQSGQAGKALTTNGSVASWGVVASGASVQVFTSSGTYTPTAGKTTFLVFATGGGGGYGNAFDGEVWAFGEGGGGGTALRFYTSTEMGTTAAITVGGAGGNSTVGGSGGSTVVDPAGTGLTITGAGGGGGDGYYPGAPGNGGGATNSLFAINGITGAGSFWAAGRGASRTAGVVLILEW